MGCGAEVRPQGSEAALALRDAAAEEETGGISDGEVPAVLSWNAASKDAAAAVPEDASARAGRAGRGGRGGRRKSQGRRQLAAQLTMRRLPDTLHLRNAGVQSQAAMEEEFWKYFGELVSEWNPC